MQKGWVGVMLKSIGVIALLAATSIARAQLTPEEAQQRLEARKAAHSAERDKLVTITQGELDDMRAQIMSLQSQVAQLRANSSVGAAPRIQAVQAIAVGENHDQVMDFMRRHPKEYDVQADNISTPNVVSRTVVHSVERNGNNTIDPRSAGNIAANQTDAERSKEQVVEEGNQTESLVLLRLAYVEVKTGEHIEFNGVDHTKVIDTAKQWAPVEKMEVHFTNGIVTSIDRKAP